MYYVYSFRMIFQYNIVMKFLKMLSLYYIKYVKCYKICIMYVNCIQRLLVIGLKIYFKVLKEGFKFQNNDIIYLLEKKCYNFSIEKVL